MGKKILPPGTLLAAQGETPDAEDLDRAADDLARGIPGNTYWILKRLSAAMREGRLGRPDIPGETVLVTDPGPTEALEARLEEVERERDTVTARLNEATETIRSLRVRPLAEALEAADGLLAHERKRVADRDEMIAALRADLEEAEDRVRRLAETGTRLAHGDGAEEVVRLISEQMRPAGSTRYIPLAERVAQLEATLLKARDAGRSMRFLLEEVLDMPPRGIERHREINERKGEIELDGGF